MCMSGSLNRNSLLHQDFFSCAVLPVCTSAGEIRLNQNAGGEKYRGREKKEKGTEKKGNEENPIILHFSKIITINYVKECFTQHANLKIIKLMRIALELQ